jgi:hypothetical protein
MVVSLRGRQPGSRGTSTAEDTADWEDIVRAVVNYSVWISDSAVVTRGYDL